MAEPISLASGLLTLTGFAFKASITLYQTIQSYQFHPKRVRDLRDELEALSSVLSSLTETVSAANNIDLSALDLPLLRCGNACKEFELEIIKCSSRSDGGRTSFRDWAKLRYMGDDIASFTQVLAGYKATINIALTDATIRQSSVTAEGLGNYKQLLKTATDDIEAHLRNMDEKLETILGRAATGTRSDSKEVQILQEERKSAQKCLEICSQLSAHIDQIQFANRRGGESVDHASSDTLPDELTNEGLRKCQDTLNSTAAKLENYVKNRLDRLIAQAGEGMTREDRAELARMREEWDTARQCVDIYAKANTHLNENISVIENYAIGDAVQFMVSTEGKTIHGKNQGLGWRTKQVGGHLNDATVQQLSRDMLGISHQNSNTEKASSQDTSSPLPNKISASEFDGRYGQGFKLRSKSSDERFSLPAHARAEGGRKMSGGS